MKKFVYLLLLFGIVCLGLSSSAWSKNNQFQNTLDVRVTGLPKEPLENVLTRLTQKQALLKDHFTKAVILRFYRSIPSEIKATISPYGFFKPVIHSHIEHNENFWVSEFHVAPGPRLKFTTVDLDIMGPGARDSAFQKLYAHFPVKAGDYFNSNKYELAKEALFNIASAQGYFSAKMEKSTIRINLSTYEAHVIIHFSTGPRYYFGNTFFSHTPFSEKFLSRFLRYKKGEHFKQAKVQHTRADLASSNYFQQVIVTPDITSTNSLYVPMKIDLSAQPKKQYTFGLGYGTDTGVRGLIGMDYRWLNPWGDRFNTYLRGSRYNSEAVANYYIPGRNPSTDQYIFTLGYLYQNQITGTGNSIRTSFTYQTEWFGWQHSFSLTYLKERYDLVDLPKTNATLVFPTYTIQRIKSDNPLHPKKGYSIVGRLLGASKNILSKTSFTQARVDSKFLLTIFKGTRLITRGTIGHTNIKNLVNLPLSLQFFAGGAQSIRGFGFNTIGPGRYIFVGSFEVQQKIKGNFYLGAFVDFGNVTDDLTGEKLKTGVGPAIVWLSPIGMFELSVANAVSQPNRPWVIQFSMGPAI